MLDERKAQVLRAVVEEYIQTAQPVGSGHVVRARGIDVSSATVRNDMAVLEQEGFLHQPHTSAGRIPTDKGYRYFVDQFAEGRRLDRMSAEQVRAFFDARHDELERMLFDTSRLLSDLTHYAAVVVGPPHEQAEIRSAQLVALNDRMALFVLVLSNGQVEKRTVTFDRELTVGVLEAASSHLQSQLVGRVTTNLGPVPPSGDRAVDPVVQACLAAFGSPTEADGEPVYVGGTARMAAEFDAVETVRQVLDILEHQLVVVGLLRDVMDRGLNVAIGSETGMAPLAECSVVVAPYEVDGERAGSIGVLGPTRMNYPQALAAVALVSRRLSHRLTEG